VIGYNVSLTSLSIIAEKLIMSKAAAQYQLKKATEKVVIALKDKLLRLKIAN
jgi:predicted DNA binding protein